MDIPFREKEVYFNLYCPKCEWDTWPEAYDVCNECLHHPSNENSHKPVNFKQKETK